MGAFMFGLVFGYLAWYSFRPGQTKGNLSIQRIGALVAIVGGATVLTLFPMGTQLFDDYALGLAIGFFFPAVKKWSDEIGESSHKEMLQRTEKREADEQEKYNQEMEKVENDWSEIEKIIKHKLLATRTFYERKPDWLCIDIDDLQELSFSPEVIEQALRKYARLHIQENVKFEIYIGKATLFRKR